MSIPSTRVSPFAWQSLLPPLQWWHRVTPSNLRADLLAGLTGAIVVLPQGVAFAAIAGMPPVYGLYAGMIPAIVAAFFGSSWHLVSGPTTAASIVLFSLLSMHAEPGSAAYVQLALTMTFLVGLTQLGLGLIRLGTLVNFISHSVVIGFTSGAALLIATNQVHNFFGIHIPRGSDFTQTWLLFLQQLDQLQWDVSLVAVVTLLAGVGARKLWPRIPYMIVALAAGTALALLLDQLNPGQSHITRVGALPASLPPLSLPDFSLSTLRMLAPGVIAVTILALTEAISIARAMALRSGQSIDADQEFVAQGLSNLIGSFFSAYVATGSFNRSGLNYDAGAKTPIAAASSGVMLIILVSMVAPMASYLPHAAMAGVLFLVAWGLINWQHIGHTLHASRAESAIMAATFLATLFFNLEIAILFGVMLSLGIYLSRTANPQVLPRIPDRKHPARSFITPNNHELCPQLRIVRIDGSLFFAAISSVQEQLEQLAPLSSRLMIVASGINFLDLSGAEFLVSEATKRRQAGGDLYLVRLKDAPYALLEKGGFLQVIGNDHLFKSKKEAFDTIMPQLDSQICAHCRTDLFQECRQRQTVDTDSSVIQKAA
ncbi:MAG: SulP family inorganic anion transporter [Magnetococcales bacterium]|nr:SulP family inorganic anion transporter [Magnetococcales bacterium]MBF0116693.1 SulP family inorganic anion transporter [Magnetococcales bacterium]